MLIIAAIVGVSMAQFAPAPATSLPLGPGAPSPAYYKGASLQSAQYPYAAILRQSQDTSFDGSFNYAYETENGISSQASGILQNPGTEVEAQVMSGSYSYTAPDGTPITVNWVADENGFRAEGAHIPQASPEIQRSIQYNLAHATAAPQAPGAPHQFRPAFAPGAPILARGGLQ